MATILVDQDLCTRCGICSVVCPMSIVDPADENTLPKVQDAKSRPVHPVRALRDLLPVAGASPEFPPR